MSEKTLVIFTSDNGSTPKDFKGTQGVRLNLADDSGDIRRKFKTAKEDARELGHVTNGLWRDGKGHPYEGGHRIPFIARWPGHIAPGTSSDHTLNLTDLFATAADVVEVESAIARIRSADWVFAGPGSPTYALAQWEGTAVPDALADKLATGGAVVFSSAAALTLGISTVPVYEVYKVGAAPFWAEGLDLLAPVGLPVAVIPHYDNTEGGNHDTRFCYLGERRLAMLEPQLPDGAFVLGGQAQRFAGQVGAQHLVPLPRQEAAEHGADLRHVLDHHHHLGPVARCRQSMAVEHGAVDGVRSQGAAARLDRQVDVE